MSRFFGPPTQSGIVVHKLEPAIAYWTGVVGAGPFYVIDDLQHESFFVGDAPAPSPGLRIALGNWGDLQIELIEPLGESPATWHRFLKQRGGGTHHTSVWTDRYDHVVDQALRRGLEVEVRGKLLNGVRYIYFRADDATQPLIEVSALLPEVAAGYAFIRQSALDWDGQDPIRRLG